MPPTITHEQAAAQAAPALSNMKTRPAASCVAATVAPPRVRSSATFRSLSTAVMGEPLLMANHQAAEPPATMPKRPRRDMRSSFSCRERGSGGGSERRENGRRRRQLLALQGYIIFTACALSAGLPAHSCSPCSQ